RWANQPRRFVTVQLAMLALVLLLSACGLPGRGAGQATTPPHMETLPSNSPSPYNSPSPSSSPQPHSSPSPHNSPLTSGSQLPPGSRLPSEADCAATIHRSAWEPRPDNHAANMSVPTAAQVAQLGPWGPEMGLDPRADGLRTQMTGNFTGTTDEILQWVACKWGFDVNIVRAEAVVESYWHQSQQGDYTSNQQYCPPGTWDGSGCYQSYGILQIKWYYFQDAWPMSKTDTAFNAEYVYAMLRACYEGWTTYLKDATPLPGYQPYHAGDIWGCLGRWYSGSWYTQGAVDYIAKVKQALAEKTWLSSGF
ncbi:MAG TPA: hypothetical protein VFU63_12965, partial [Ktedonobacterales bacterium]|nr:hypothetical protein [Ktedonobacterales bacterium]